MSRRSGFTTNRCELTPGGGLGFPTPCNAGSRPRRTRATGRLQPPPPPRPPTVTFPGAAGVKRPNAHRRSRCRPCP